MAGGKACGPAMPDFSAAFTGQPLAFNQAPPALPNPEGSVEQSRKRIKEITAMDSRTLMKLSRVKPGEWCAQ